MSQDQNVARGLANLRIMMAPLMGGLTLFIVIVWLVADASFEASSITSPEPFWLFALLGFVVLEAVFYVVGSRLVVSQARTRHASKPLTDEEIVGEFVKATLIRAALIEGLGFFGCVVFLVAAQGLGLLVAALCVFGLLATFPTDGRYRSFREALTRPE